MSLITPNFTKPERQTLSDSGPAAQQNLQAVDGQAVALASVLVALRTQQVIAYPTEAVFGLGCDPEDAYAVTTLLALKQRPWQKGLILVAAHYAQLLPYVDDSQLVGAARQRVMASWPGPITWTLPAHLSTPHWLTGHFNTIAVRVSAHPTVQLLCTAFGKPLTSTSANRAGTPPCRSAAEVQSQFGFEFPILAGHIGTQRQPSEIRDALTNQCWRAGTL